MAESAVSRVVESLTNEKNRGILALRNCYEENRNWLDQAVEVGASCPNNVILVVCVSK